MQDVDANDDFEHDPLLRFDRAGVVDVLEAYYRGNGWWVERPVGADFDLRMKRDREVLLLHCGYWDAGPVAQHAVHEAVGLMVGDGATGALLVCRGGFAPAAVEAAARSGRVRLIDLAALRVKLGHLPEVPVAGDPFVEALPADDTRAQDMPGAMSDRHRSAAASAVRPRASAGLRPWLLPLLGLLAFVIVVVVLIRKTVDTASSPDASDQDAVSAPRTGARPAVAACCKATVSSLAEWKRRNAESMKVLERDTPEM